MLLLSKTFDKIYCWELYRYTYIILVHSKLLRPEILVLENRPDGSESFASFSSRSIIFSLIEEVVGEILLFQRIKFIGHTKFSKASMVVST